MGNGFNGERRERSDREAWIGILTGEGEPQTSGSKVDVGKREGCSRFLLSLVGVVGGDNPVRDHALRCVSLSRTQRVHAYLSDAGQQQLPSDILSSTGRMETLQISATNQELVEPTPPPRPDTFQVSPVVKREEAQQQR